MKASALLPRTSATHKALVNLRERRATTVAAVHRMRRSLQAILLMALPICAIARPARAAEAGLFLSFRGAYGTETARDTVYAACDDTSRADTLYLCFRVARPTPPLSRMSAVVYFHPQPGDTLRDFWFFKPGWPNENNLLVDFSPSGVPHADSPFLMTAIAGVTYDHRSGRGRLDLQYEEPDKGLASPLEPERLYCFAAVRILHRRSNLPGCTQPVCIKWGSARLHFATGREMDLPLQGSRYAGWNMIRGISCVTGGAAHRIAPWRPKPPVTTP